MLNKLRKRQGIGRSGRGGMWVTAGVLQSQDEPHGEEPAIAHAPADEEEEQGLGEWAAEEENEEHEEIEH